MRLIDEIAACTDTVTLHTAVDVLLKYVSTEFLVPAGHFAELRQEVHDFLASQKSKKTDLDVTMRETPAQFNDLMWAVAAGRLALTTNNIRVEGHKLKNMERYHMQFGAYIS